MILALMWLTISAPFVYECQQQLAKYSKSSSVPMALDITEDETNPFGNNTEEKAPNSINSFSEEYLHDNHHLDYLLLITSQFQKCDNAGTYIAYHGELLVPPPNVL
jgi:hypothetical protein